MKWRLNRIKAAPILVNYLLTKPKKHLRPSVSGFLEYLSRDLVEVNDPSLLAGDREARLGAVWVRFDLSFRNSLIDDGIRRG